MSWFKKKEVKIKEEPIYLESSRCPLASDSLWQAMWDVEKDNIATMGISWEKEYKRWCDCGVESEQWFYMQKHKAKITTYTIGRILTKLILGKDKEEIEEWLHIVCNHSVFCFETEALKEFTWGVYKELSEASYDEH